MLQRVQSTIRRFGLLDGIRHVLVAVSGGSDSVALLLCLREWVRRSGLRLTIAHLNHGLRGAQAAADERHVRRLAKELNLPVVVGHARVTLRAKRRGWSLEMAARQARYEFLARAVRRVGADAVATGHTADDQAETLLLRLIRGAGPPGWGGVPPASVVQGARIIRPLIECRRAEIEAYLRRQEVGWREDQSNRDTAILRNRVRHELLPWLERAFHPKVRDVLAREARLAADENEWGEKLTSEALMRCRAPAGESEAGRHALAVARLQEEPPALRRRVLRRWLLEEGYPADEMNMDSLERIGELIRTCDGTRIEPLAGEYAARRVYGTLTLTRRKGEAATKSVWPRPLPIPGAVVIEAIGARFTARLGPGIVKERGKRPGAMPAQATISASRCKDGRLMVRPWRRGDRMKPFGLKGHRKIQDILTDEKVPRDMRGRVWVVACGEAIVWLPGYRVAADWAVPENECHRAVQLAVVPIPRQKTSRR